MLTSCQNKLAMVNLKTEELHSTMASLFSTQENEKSLCTQSSKLWLIFSKPAQPETLKQDRLKEGLFILPTLLLKSKEGSLAFFERKTCLLLIVFSIFYITKI